MTQASSAPYQVLLYYRYVPIADAALPGGGGAPVALTAR